MGHPVFAASHTALITGAGSGIGLAIAQLCARHGMKIALVDSNPETLTLAKSSLGTHGNANADAETYVADVSDRERWRNLRLEVGKRFGQVNLLVLNAGTAPKGGWEDIEYWHKAFDTNLFGVVNGIATFLPSLRAQSASTTPKPYAVVLTGSKQGITNPPGNPAYNATKAALRSLAESLAYDLREDADRGGSVHLLVPGWTFTGMTGGGASTTRQKPDGAWEPSQVADFLERKMAEGQFYVLCPDNEVSEETDRKRVLWGTGDLVEGRPPLSRWREDWKDRAKEGIENMTLPEKV